jgi:hypothetical protein
MGGEQEPTLDLVRVVCTAWHPGQETEFASGSLRVLCLMELAPLEGGGFTLREQGISSAVMTRVKRSLAVRQLGRGAWTYRFICGGREGCGLDKQRHEDKLMEFVAALFRYEREKDPGATQIDLPIQHLLLR